jgi:hypothetical protein
MHAMFNQEGSAYVVDPREAASESKLIAQRNTTGWGISNNRHISVVSTGDMPNILSILLCSSIAPPAEITLRIRFLPK